MDDNKPTPVSRTTPDQTTPESNSEKLASSAEQKPANSHALALKDYLALLLSSLSFVVATSGFYFTHLRLGEVQASIGPKVHLYYPRDGGAALYLPIHLLNDSSAKGIVRKAFLQITDSSTGATHIIAWMRRARVLEDGNYKDVAGNDPFYVEAKSYSDDWFWFWWPDDERAPLTFEATEYTFKLFVWTNNEARPSIESRAKLILEPVINFDLTSHKFLEINVRF